MTPDTFGRSNVVCVRFVTPAEIRRLRNRFGESASVFSKRLSVSRHYFKELESGSKRIRPRIAQIVGQLEKEIGGESRAVVKPIVVESSFELPEHFRLMVKPRACRGHRELHVFRNSRQVYCNKECRKLYLRRQRRKEEK